MGQPAGPPHAAHHRQGRSTTIRLRIRVGGPTPNRELFPGVSAGWGMFWGPRPLGSVIRDHAENRVRGRPGR